MIVARGRRWGRTVGTLTVLGVLGVLAPARQATAGVLDDVPVRPSREQARGWALEELGRREYVDARPGLVERGLRWLFEQISEVRVSSEPVSLVVLTVVLAVILGLIAWAVHRAGGLRRTARRAGTAVLDSAGTTSAQHRELAEQHAAAGDWGAAVLERFRAVARTLEEHAVLAPQPGRTADELARDGGAWLPELAADLAAGARLFDDVCYGHRTVGQEAYTRLRALDERLQDARPVAAPDAPGSRLAVPT